MKPIEEKKSYKGETQRKLNKSLYLSQKVNVPTCILYHEDIKNNLRTSETIVS